MGDLVNAMPDMWYVEGTWQPASTEAAEEFTKAASQLSAKVVMEDPTKGFRAELFCDGKFAGHIFVHSLQDGSLFVRRVFDKRAVEWLLANVSE